MSQSTCTATTSSPMNKTEPDWNPQSKEVLKDQRAAYDEMRERCPIAYSEFLGWSVFRHEDVVQIINDHETFSSAVSRHLTVPAGMDPPEHTTYRRIIDGYFTPKRMAAFEPTVQKIAGDLARSAVTRGEVELMNDLALPFAVHAQCAFLGWPPRVQKVLIDWTRRNYQATLAQDRKAMSDIAREFEGLVDEMLDARHQADQTSEEDAIASLVKEEVWGRSLSNEEISSILRTWTVGEIGSIASSVGILVQYLAEDLALQKQLRADTSLLPAAIDEILRIHGPLVANRRVTTRPVEIGDRQIDAGERISVNWVSANRDPRVFDEPDTFRLDRDPADNLLYGAGIHVCPGAPLARMEMRVALEELHAVTSIIELIPNNPSTNAVYPASGFATLPVRMQ